MSTLTVNLPESLHAKIEELARAEGISVNQFLATAAAEKMSALLTQDYLEREARNGSRNDFENVLKAVPDIEPEEFDRLSVRRLPCRPPAVDGDETSRDVT